MLNILLASPRRDRFAELKETLSSLHPVAFAQAVDGCASLAHVRQKAVDLVVVDENLDDMSGIDLVRQLLAVNALVHTALVTSETPDSFHERTEGLGVLMPLPPHCGRSEAVVLLDGLRRLGVLADTPLQPV